MSQQLNLAIFCHFLSSERSFCLGCHDRHGSSGVARWTCSWGPTLVLGPQKRGGRQKVPSKSTGTHKEICNLLDSITLQLTVRPCQIGLGRCVSTKNCFFCRVWVYVRSKDGKFLCCSTATHGSGTSSCGRWSGTFHSRDYVGVIWYHFFWKRQ